MKHLHLGKRFLALTLAATFVFAMPLSALATEGGEPIESQEEVPTTLRALISAAKEGAKVTLDKDYIEDVVIASGENVILNLAGHTLKGTDTSGTATIKVEKGATLTIEGEGTIINNSTGNGAACIFNEGTVTIENGTIKKETGNKSYYNIANHGKMIINGGTILNDTPYEEGKSHASLVENGYYNYTSTNPILGYVEGVNEARPSLEINGGTFDGGLNTIKNDDGATLVIHDAIVKNQIQVAVFNVSEATINGGQFDVPAGNDKTTVFNRKYDDDTDKGILTVTGGEFKADYFVEVINNATEAQMGEITITGGIFHVAKGIVNTEGRVDITTLKIAGGRFSVEPSDEKLAEEVIKAERESGEWLVGKEVVFTLQFENGEEDKVEKYIAGEEVTLPSGEREGYEFKGWKKDDETIYQAEEKLTLNESLTLTAMWEEMKSEEVSSGDNSGDVSGETQGETKPSDSGSHSSGSTSYMITVLETENGTVTPSGNIKIDRRADQKLTFQADEGYELDKVLVDDKEVEVKDNSYTIEKVTSSHEVKVTFKKIVKEKIFSDVNNEDWFSSYIEKAKELKLMNGISDNQFAPNEELTRGMAVTILYRLAGSEEKEEVIFDDVAKDAYYASAVAWALKNKIVEGTGGNKFEPDRAITREEFATIMYRYVKNEGKGFGEKWEYELSYADKDEVSSFAKEAICWSTKNEIIKGKEDNLLDAKSTATRAEAATMIVRLAALMEK